MRPDPKLSRLFALLCAVAVLAPAFAAEPDVLVTVNGKPIKRTAVQDRVWSLHASDVLNQMVDEDLVQQALTDFETKGKQKDKDAWKKEIDARFGRVRDQFKDEASFNEQLKKSGTNADTLRKQIESQVMREQLVISAKKLTVKPEEVSAFFEANKEKLSSKEAVHLRHILISDEKQAKDVLVALRVGADFSKLAQEISLDTGSRDRGGDLGFVARGMVIPDIDKVAFSMKSGQVSDLIKTQLGYSIIKVEEKREAKPAVFKDIEKDLTQAVLAQKITQTWPVYVKELRDSAKIDLSPAVTSGPKAASAAPAPAAKAAPKAAKAPKAASKASEPKAD